MVKAGRITFQELYYTRTFRNRFISALSDPISSITICSPFFDRLPSPFQNVGQFCRFMQKRGTEKIQIVTRPPGCDKQAMAKDVAKDLNSLGVELFIRPKPYHHAKMYHFEYLKGYFRCFVGSANFTLGGFERNYEIVAEMEGVGEASPCHRELKRMQETGGTLTYQAWVARGQPEGEQEQP
jgi:phosphatidylserine/phosphatidylglycerophosphate/cardiolipin synthase-like enzyme